MFDGPSKSNNHITLFFNFVLNYDKKKAFSIPIHSTEFEEVCDTSE